MAGIYIHIPFCKQACHYCNFHFSTTLHLKEEMLKALLQEIELRHDYLSEKTLETIYFGGGTPSILDTGQLVQIFERIYRHFSIAKDAEITLEANPDDMSDVKLKTWKASTPVNRLSVGIQSFFDEDLQWMNRAHQAGQALDSLDLAHKHGFDNLSIDLIYGAPTTTDERWLENLETARERRIPHLSCYALTVEEGTALGAWVKKGLHAPMDEEKASRQFAFLMAFAAAHGYEHYEISNFAFPGKYARHNTNYWRSKPYLGIGPSAHSFDGTSRQWNIAHNPFYIHAVLDGNPRFEKEMLNPAQQYNEYIMTGLRTMWGLAQQKLQAFGSPFVAHFEQESELLIKKGYLQQKDGVFTLTKEGKFLADQIASDLFYV